MKKALLTLFTVMIGTTAMAQTQSIEKAAEEIKNNSTRTQITVVENTEDNPCLPDGKSYQVDLQVKQSSFNRIEQKIQYRWETVKTVFVDMSGDVIEVCAE